MSIPLLNQNVLDALDTESRLMKVRANILDSKYRILESLEGELVDDSFVLDADNDVRISYSCQFITVDSEKYIIAKDSYLFFDKFLQVFMGIYSIRDREYHWFSLGGIFAMNTISFRFDQTSNAVHLNCLDLTSMFNSTRGSQISGLSLSIPAVITDADGREITNTIRGAIISTLEQAGINHWRVADINGSILTDNGYEMVPNIPYDIDLPISSTPWDILVKLRDIYPGWQMYFDEATFICEQIPLNTADPVVADEMQIAKVYLSEDVNVDLSMISNVCEVFGKLNSADFFTANIDGEPDAVMMSGNTYSLHYITSSLSNNTNFGFTADADNLINPRAQIFNGDKLLGTFDILGADNEPLPAEMIKANKSYVLQYKSIGRGALYYLGEYMIIAINKLVSKDPSLIPAKISPTDNSSDPSFISMRNYDLLNEITTNISYTISDSPFAIDEIGEIRNVLSDEAIWSEKLAMDRATYENWLTSEYQERISIEIVSLPYLRPNHKIRYHSPSLGTTQEYIIKSISGSSFGTSTISLLKFRPFYPWLT